MRFAAKLNTMKKCILIVFLTIFLALPVNGEVYK